MSMIDIKVGHGRLIKVSEKLLKLREIADPQEKERVWEEMQDHVEMELRRFSIAYPQLVLDESPNGVKNVKEIGLWLKEKGVLPEYPNLVEALHDLYVHLIFDPSKIGMHLGKPATGKVLSNRPDVSATQWNALLSPHADLPKPDDRLSAEAYKAAHPEGWAEFRVKEKEAELEHVKQESSKLLALRPQFVSNDQNIKQLLDELQKSGSRVTSTNLCNVFDQLVRTGKLEANGNVTSRSRGMTRTDFSGSDTGRDLGTSESYESAMRFVKSHTSQQIEERLLKDKNFKAVLDRGR